MENNANELLMDKLVKVCTCKAISRASIKKAILDGAETVDEVKKRTGAGSGGCKGKRCTEVIIKLLEQLNNEN